MSIAEIKMCIAEIDAKLQEKAECGGVMPEREMPWKEK